MRDDGNAGHRKHSPAAAYYRLVLLAVAVVGVALQAASLGALRGSFWGFHLFAFVPRWGIVLGWTAVAAAAAMLLYSPSWRRGTQRSEPRFNKIPAWTVVALAAVCAVLFWVFRSQQTLLGDGLPLSIDLPRGQSFHPRQPLAMWLQEALYRTLSGALAGGETIAPLVAQRTVAVGSVVAGALFVVVAFALGRAFSRREGRDDMVSLLVTLVLLCQGYAALFFGYVENYTYFLLAIALYLLTAVLYLRRDRRAPFAVVSVALVLCVGVHLSSVALVPSFLYLAAVAVVRPGRRLDALFGLATFALAGLLLDWLLRWLSPGYTLWTGVSQVLNIAQTTQGGGAGWSYMLTAVHLRDFFNEHYLIGPLAAFLFVPALAYAVRRRGYRDPIGVFLALAAGVYLVGSWATSEPLLGYARDWDLFAAAGACYCAAAMYFLVSHNTRSFHARRLLGFAAVLSAVHLIPWVAINHSEALTLERFKTLPLGLGKTEVAVANWYMRNNQNANAETWFKRALDANPNNVNAYFLLGVLYANNGFADPACKFIEQAVKIRPDKPDYRRKYVEVLFEAERCRDAVPHLLWLAEGMPGDFRYWQRIGEDMIRLGCREALTEVYAPALKEAERQIQANPRDEVTYVFAGILLGNVERVDQALAMFQRSLEVRPDSPAGLFNAGMALTQMGRPHEARPYLERFVALYPDHPMNEFARETLSR
jgi:tetratricopeptide (TPR) repeat protein